jgi:hypothetical protein
LKQDAGHCQRAANKRAEQDSRKARNNEDVAIRTDSGPNISPGHAGRTDPGNDQKDNQAKRRASTDYSEKSDGREPAVTLSE